MTCREMHELLSPYYDGRAPAAQAREVEAHLQECQGCSAEMDALRFASLILASLPAARLPEDLAPQVVARASAPRWKERWEAALDFIVPRQAFLISVFSRAVAVIALLLLAASVRGRGPSDLVISWPGRVAGAAGAGMARLTAGLAEAQVFLDAAAGTLPSPPASAPFEKARPAPAQPSRAPSSSPVATNHQEVSSHVLA